MFGADLRRPFQVTSRDSHTVQKPSNVAPVPSIGYPSILRKTGKGDRTLVFKDARCLNLCKRSPALAL